MKKIWLICFLFINSAHAMGVKDFCLALKEQNYDYLAQNSTKKFYIKSKDSDEITAVSDDQVKIVLKEIAKDDGGFDENGTSHIEYLKDKSCDILSETDKPEFMFGSFHLIKVKENFVIDYVFK